MHTILLIDSCPLTRECLSMILRAKGNRVQSATLISQAKTMISKRPPDLIITEIRLPDDNALNLMRHLRNDHSALKIRVCLLTQAAAKKPILEAIELGVCKVMLKSKFTVSGFLDQVHSIGLNKIHSHHEPAAEQAREPSEVRYSLPMPAEDPALLLKTIKPIISRSDLNEKLEEITDLNALSEPIARLIEAIDSPEAEIEKIADLIKMDQTIAIKVMRIANSSTYARGEQTVTLKDAVLRIGLEHLRELIIGIGIIDRLGVKSSAADEPEGRFDHHLLWEHALCAAVCSSKIAQLCEGVNPEAAFTAAILHDIGRVIALQALPEHYPRVLSTAHKLGVGLELAEKRMLLTDHTTVAQTILHAWNLPKDLIDAIAHHHCVPNKLPTECPKNTKLAAIVELGNRMTHALGIGSSGNRTISPTEDLFELIGSPELTIGTLKQGLADQIRDMRSLIFVPTAEDRSPIAKNNTQHPAFDRAFHPLYITMAPEHDAIGQWVMSHGDSAETDGAVVPNIAIVHAHHARDRQNLAEKLAEAQLRIASELGSGAQPIPVLILSSTGKIALPDETLTRHPSLHLMTPFSVLHFEQAVNHLLNGMVRPQENWTPRKAA